MTVTHFQLVMVPTSMGQVGIQIYGLGDDNKMYQWMPVDTKWEVVKGN